jgi:hypothetical protein
VRRYSPRRVELVRARSPLECVPTLVPVAHCTGACSSIKDSTRLRSGRRCNGVCARVEAVYAAACPPPLGPRRPVPHARCAGVCAAQPAMQARSFGSGVFTGGRERCCRGAAAGAFRVFFFVDGACNVSCNTHARTAAQAVRPGDRTRSSSKRASGAAVDGICTCAALCSDACINRALKVECGPDNCTAKGCTNRGRFDSGSTLRTRVENVCDRASCRRGALCVCVCVCVCVCYVVTSCCRGGGALADGREGSGAGAAVRRGRGRVCWPAGRREAHTGLCC